MHPDAIWPKAGAKPGDVLFLTKPLGTGIVLQAERDGIAPSGSLDAAIESMLELNRDAADALRPFTPNAVTDVTGFGLLGHVHELASRSGVRAVIDAESLPLLPAALELAEQGVRTGGDRRNRDYAGPHVESDADAALEALAYDPQTAGGLLISLPAERGAVLEATFASRGLIALRASDRSKPARESFSARWSPRSHASAPSLRAGSSGSRSPRLSRSSSSSPRARSCG